MIETGNPYPQTGVATLQEPLATYVTIDTPMLTSTLAHIDRDYFDKEWSLTAFSLPRPAGLAISFCGEPGTGKTHLLRQLIERIRLKGVGTAVIMEQARSDFLPLFRTSFYSTFTNVYLGELMDSCFADFVEDQMHEVYRESFKRERTQPGFNARQFLIEAELNIDKFEDEFLAECAGELSHVPAANDIFAYFRRRDSSSWSTLVHCGDSDEKTYTELARAERDEYFLSAAQIILQVFAHRGGRLVVAIDEGEKIFTEEGATAANNAILKRLVEIVTRTGNLFFIAALPEFQGLLSNEASDRFYLKETLSAWDVSEICALLDASNKRLPLEKRVTFSPPAQQMLAQITSGNPRYIIRIMYHLHKDYLESSAKTSIGIDDIRNLTRNLFEQVTDQEIVTTCRLVFERSGALIKAPLRTSANEGLELAGQLVDIVASFEAEEASVYVLISKSIIKDSSYEVLAQKVCKVRPLCRDDTDRVLLIINGYIFPEYRENIRAEGANIVYSVKPLSLEEDLENIVQDIKDSSRAVLFYKSKSEESEHPSLARLSSIDDRLNVMMNRLERRSRLSSQEAERIARSILIYQNLEEFSTKDSYGPTVPGQIHTLLKECSAAPNILLASHQRLCTISFCEFGEHGLSRSNLSMRRFIDKLLVLDVDRDNVWGAGLIGAAVVARMVVGAFFGALYLFVAEEEKKADVTKSKVDIITKNAIRLLRDPLQIMQHEGPEFLKQYVQFLSFSEMEASYDPDYLHLGLGRKTLEEFSNSIEKLSKFNSIAEKASKIILRRG